jgi:hypothetical protein
METKLTAVEWLALYIKGITNLNCDEVINQAKAMEKEQIIEAINYGCSDWGSFKDVEQYYKDTYEK